MQKHAKIRRILSIMIALLLLAVACTNPEGLTGIQDDPNTIIPKASPISIETEVPAAEPPSPPVEPRFHIIWDDDGSSDGVIALMYLLQNPEVNVIALTVSNGIAYPREFAKLLERMLVKLDRTEIPVGAGSETPLVGDNAFPERWRWVTNEFWGIKLPEIPDQKEARGAAELIVEVINASPEPVTFFISGTHTNLVQALRLDPSIKENIASIEVMGGALYVPGNIASEWEEGKNKTAEWNIYVDPLAAQEVFSSGIPMTLTPLDATNQVVWDRLDAGAWRNSATPESTMASELLSWMLNNWSDVGIFVWDLDTAVNLTHPEFCASEYLYVEVITDKGADEGRTLVIDGEKSNLSACLQPNSDAIRRHVKEVFRAN